MPADSPLARWAADSVPDSGGLPRPGPEPPDRGPTTGSRWDSIVRSIIRCIPPPRSWRREGVAVVHVMKYLGTDTNASSQAVEQELESFLDQLQPGWKEHVVARRFLPGNDGRTRLAACGKRTVCWAGRRCGARTSAMFSWPAIGSDRRECWRTRPRPAPPNRPGRVLAALGATTAAERSPLHVAS